MKMTKRKAAVADTGSLALLEEEAAPVERNPFPPPLLDDELLHDGSMIVIDYYDAGYRSFAGVITGKQNWRFFVRRYSYGGTDQKILHLDTNGEWRLSRNRDPVKVRFCTEREVESIRKYRAMRPTFEEPTVIEEEEPVELLPAKEVARKVVAALPKKPVGLKALARMVALEYDDYAEMLKLIMVKLHAMGRVQKHRIEKEDGSGYVTRWSL